jgi:DeoR/GlpR family transcriptional regulator of sugar metabolism
LLLKYSAVIMAKLSKRNVSMTKRNTQQRRHAIATLVQERGEISVDELTRRFATSEVTIRKDLALLETGGLLLRRYGGAVRCPAKWQSSRKWAWCLTASWISPVQQQSAFATTTASSSTAAPPPAA